MTESKIESLDNIARGYDPSDPSQHFDYWFKRFEAEACLPFLAGRHILELGGATGESAALLCPHADRYVIVEGSSINCDAIRSRLPHVEVVESLWESFEPDATFSDVILFETLEHYDDPVSLLSRCRSWLRKGGRVHISVPNGESLHRRIAVKMGLMEGATELTESDLRQGHVRNYTLPLLREHVQSAGFSEVSVRGLFLKTTPNSMMLTWPEELLMGINEFASDIPEQAAELFLVAQN